MSNCAAYNGFGKPDSEAVYVNVTCEYIIYSLKATLIIVLNRDTFPFIFSILICALIYLY